MLVTVGKRFQCAFFYDHHDACGDGKKPWLLWLDFSSGSST